MTQLPIPDAPEGQSASGGELPLNGWATAIIQIATHYRLPCSPGMIMAAAEWQGKQTRDKALRHLARQAGLSLQLFAEESREITRWRLPLAVELDDGQVGVVTAFDGDDRVRVHFSGDEQPTPVMLTDLLPALRVVAALRPVAAAKDSRVDRYLATVRPDWLRRLVLHDLRPYGYVMLASFLINLLALVGIVFSMQVYDRVIPAQSYPTLYVLYAGVIISVVFTYILRVGRDHVTDLLGKRADMRVSDRVFGHALRLRNSVVPRSTGTFISQLRELEAIREMVTSTTVTAIVDMPFFLLFLLVMAIIAPQLAWIAPVAVLLMVLPGLLSQKKLAKLAQQALKESTLRNAVLVESVQGLEDIKLMQAEDRFLQQWNSYIRITAQSGVAMRKVMHSLISWGVTVQGLVYASVIVVGAPMVINGDITTGAIVAASLLSSRMIAPMATLCGVLARWQQVRAAKTSLDGLMNLPVENSSDETRIHCPVLFGHYQFTDAMFRYYSDSLTMALRIKSLTIQPGERIAVLGRNGSGKSTLLQAMAGGMDLVSGELRLDNLSLPHIDVADVRRNVGLLTQNARLFHGTLRENLTLGAAHATDDAIFSALTVSGGAEFIRRLPLGLDHPIMEGGTGLSGGQRQSLLLARMLLRDPNIVLLDEPTAALDDHTEKEFIERLGAWLNGRTLIVATHRAAILSLVDRILVLKEGQLVMDSPKEKALPPARSGGNLPEVNA
ncbi:MULTISPECIES: type I secretion system permease/ATPase [Pantoea]|jgi:ATP-binding cassette subfamily C protein LapB|uniref:ABC-type xenobiotic transporter n=1 Tax=Pantoea eucrina TaxID=472693 RepID=A0ABS1Z2W0_9GAMM|nr:MULTISPECIES: type I secretion system permease/ATPase [Pantoea]AIX49200.1 ATP-binding protein [Pantoea sp. PSNIH1]MBM0746744.1 type I secretion system permease/ATPase [Pantoea eucrina]MCL9647297.1 type I secretion system permease/ATPase [Pantoea eucrina]MDJ0024037.1 type I secretion system permease/ATPase [Pantoea eucrina]NIE71207.1 type I secretion system permease/ATPase [Pantoea sp. Acro-807]